MANHCCDWTGPCGSYDCKTSLVITSGNLGGKFITQKSLKLHGTPRGHIARLWRELMGLGSAFIGVEGGF